MSARKRPGRLLRPLMWGALGLWAVVLGVFYVTRSARPAPTAGEQVLRPGLTGRNMEGRELMLLPRDSAVAVLAATSECAACRAGVPGYHDIAERLRREGVAFRAVVGSDSVGARQFSRLLPEPGSVLWDPDQKLFRSLGMRAVPSLYLVGRDGRLLKSWTPLSGDPRVADQIASEARAAR